MAVRLPSMPSVGSLLKLYKLYALKKLSQNFLLQPKVIDKFVKAAGPLKGGLVCEVGPGPGGITRSILRQCPKHLLLVEKDERFHPMLEGLQVAAKSVTNIDISYCDILEFNMADVFDESYAKNWEDKPPNIHILGNLPFDVSTILMIRWLEDISLRRNVWKRGRVKMTLTFQKEVGERIVAPILTKKRCRLSVISQNYCKVDHKFVITGKSFIPAPKVDVSVVTLEPLIKPVISHPFPVVEKVLRTVFNCRQKYISFGVKKLFPVALREKLSEELLVKAEVDPKMRPFQVTVDEYGRIVNAYVEICLREPGLYSYDYRGRRDKRETSWAEEDNDDSDDLEVGKVRDV